MSKICHLSLLSLMLLGACQQSSQDSGSEAEVKVISPSVEDRINARADSLEDLADKMREEDQGERTVTIQATLAYAWTADKNLRTIRSVTLKNTSDAYITGVKLVYLLRMGEKYNERPMGKFKVKLKPHGSTMLKIPAKQFGVLDSIIDEPAWALQNSDKIFASVIYFSDGSVENNRNPFAETSSTL